MFVRGEDGDFGEVAPGQRADLLLLGANPLENLDALSQRAGTMVRGHWVSGEDIATGLKELAEKHSG